MCARGALSLLAVGTRCASFSFLLFASIAHSEPKEPASESSSAPSLSLPPGAPQVGGLITSPARPPPMAEAPAQNTARFEMSGYLRAPLRLSWGPPTGPNRSGDAGTQLLTPPLVDLQLPVQRAGGRERGSEPTATRQRSRRRSGSEWDTLASFAEIQAQLSIRVVMIGPWNKN